MTQQPQLVPDAPQITVYCFFRGRCKHVVRATDPMEAHDEMERHYEDRHHQAIERIVG